MILLPLNLLKPVLLPNVLIYPKEHSMCTWEECVLSCCWVGCYTDVFRSGWLAVLLTSFFSLLMVCLCVPSITGSGY